MSGADTLLERVARWTDRDPRDPLTEFSALVRTSPAGLERSIVGVLDKATPAARDFLCRELSLIGTSASVPALARLLGDPASAEIACYALARIPDAAARGALRAALPKAKGPLRASIASALGERGVAKSMAALALPASVAAQHATIAGGTAPREFYVRLNRPGVAAPLRAAALYKLGDVKTLAAALDDPDSGVQGAAISLLSRIPGAEVTKLFLARYAALSPIGRLRVLAALGDRGDSAARPMVVKAATADSPELRIAALNALRFLGDATTAPLLARIAAETSGAEQAAAREALAMMRAEGVDEAIASGIDSSTGNLRLELIAAAGDRGSPVAGPALLATVRGTDAAAAQAALRAMRAVAGPEHAPALLELLTQVSAAPLRRDASATLASVLRRTAQPRIEPVIEAYRAAADRPLRLTLLDVMGQVSAPAALPVLRAGLKDADAEVARASILALSAWQTPEPLPDLLAAARTESNAARQVLAVRGAIKLIAIPSERPPAESAGLLRSTWELAKQTAEKRAILALLPLFPVAESVALGKSAAADASVAKEAAVALDALAELGVR